jgi:hypothetical protein
MKTYSTYDLNLASVILTLGYKLIELDKENIKKVKFIFKHQKGIEQSADDFWDDKIILPAKTLFTNQKTLKNRIYTDA